MAGEAWQCTKEDTGGGHGEGDIAEDMAGGALLKRGSLHQSRDTPEGTAAVEVSMPAQGHLWGAHMGAEEMRKKEQQKETSMQ